MLGSDPMLKVSENRQNHMKLQEDIEKIRSMSGDNVCLSKSLHEQFPF